jgi:hypothetical protein
LGGKTFVFVAATKQQDRDGKTGSIAIQKPVELGAIEGNNYQKYCHSHLADFTIARSGSGTDKRYF